MKLDGSVVFVTGSNKGLGRSLLDGVLARGAAKVYAASRTPATYSDSRVVPVALDITDRAAVASAAAAAKDTTLLVNNAGVLTGYSLLADDASAKHDMEVNYHGVLSVMRAFAPILVENAATRGGAAMFNVLSVVAFAPMPVMGGYSASKAAQWSAVQSFRAALRSKHVAVHAAFPGAIDTDMIRHIDAPKNSPESIAKAILDGIAAGTEDIGTDGLSIETLAQWQKDPHALAQQFAAWL